MFETASLFYHSRTVCELKSKFRASASSVGKAQEPQELHDGRHQ